MMIPILLVGALLGALWSASDLQAQIPTALTDRIYQGSGSINLLKDVSAANLQQYLTSNGGLLLGIDVNENESGNESRNSLGIAVKQLELVIKTTAGTFSFSDFMTSTTAVIKEAGATSAKEFYTAFGKSGSSQITGGTDGFDLGRLDDVIRLQNVSFEGTILEARLNVTFLNTAKTSTQGNETFFDFSGGFEDFALLGKKDAVLLEAANFGVAASPSDVTYMQTTPTITASETSLPAAPGAPVPPLVLLLSMGVLVAWKAKGAKRDGKV